jgi:DNA-directed RNA polymerase specialized sigma24 family protein
MNESLHSRQVAIDSRAVVFRGHRSRLYGIAYRMLGSKADAEDMLQEAYLRWHQAQRRIGEYAARSGRGRRPTQAEPLGP